MLMPDLGTWGVMDAMSEKYARWSPYNYAINNPVMVVDPDGNDAMFSSSASGEAAQQAFRAYVATMSTSTETSGGNVFTGLDNNRGKDPKPGFLGTIGNFFKNLFGGNKGAGIETYLPGATVIRMPTVQVGEVTRIGAEVAGIVRLGIWGLPLMLNGDSSHARGYDVPLTSTTDVPADEPEQMITLYRGVSSKIFHNDNRQYLNAHFGVAIPKGYYQVSTLSGPHRDMEEHAGGDNYSIWTSWSSSKEVARDFATGIAFGKAVPGIIMSKTFRLGEATPNPFTLAEAEWLIPGVVYGAKVEYVLPRAGQ